MGISEADPLHKQIKALMLSMVMHVANCNYVPTYFKMAPFQNFELDWNTMKEIETPLRYFMHGPFPGLPIVYSDGCPIKLYCKDWVVLKINWHVKHHGVWENQVFRVESVVGVRYHFYEERDDEFI